METVLEDYKKFNSYNEAYEVVKTAEVVGYDRNMYRVEVLKSFSNPNVPFSVRYLIQEHVMVQPTYPMTGDKFERKPEDMTVFVDIAGPWVAAQTAEDALSQALSFLAERAGHRA